MMFTADWIFHLARDSGVDTEPSGALIWIVAPIFLFGMFCFFVCGRNVLGFGSAEGLEMANHASTRTTQLYDRRRADLSLDEVERVVILFHKVATSASQERQCFFIKKRVWLFL